MLRKLIPSLDVKTSATVPTSVGSFHVVNNELKEKSKALVPWRSPAIRNVRPKRVSVKGRRGRRGGSRNESLPSEIAIFPIVSTKLRFKNPSAAVAAGTTGIITVDDVFGAILCVGRVANTSVTPIATSFRLKRVSIWISGSASAQADAGIIWFSANSDQEPDFEKVDQIQQFTGLSQVVTSRPPSKSTAGFWYRNTMSPVNTAVMGLTISNLCSIVEVDLDWTLPTGVVSSATISVSTATVGAMYRLSLNKTNGSSSLVPFDYTTTT